MMKPDDPNDHVRARELAEIHRELADIRRELVGATQEKDHASKVTT